MLRHWHVSASTAHEIGENDAFPSNEAVDTEVNPPIQTQQVPLIKPFDIHIIRVERLTVFTMELRA